MDRCPKDAFYQHIFYSPNFIIGFYTGFKSVCQNCITQDFFGCIPDCQL